MSKTRDNYKIIINFLKFQIMGLFSKKNKVIQLTSYDQLGEGNKIFPRTYFLDEVFMSEQNMSRRFPPKVSCTLSSNDRYPDKNADQATFTKKRSGYNSYLIEIGSSRRRVEANSVIPMTPIGTELRDGRCYTLLVKGESCSGNEVYDFDKQGKGRWTKHFNRLYVIDHKKYTEMQNRLWREGYEHAYLCY